MQNALKKRLIMLTWGEAIYLSNHINLGTQGVRLTGMRPLHPSYPLEVLHTRLFLVRGGFHINQMQVNSFVPYGGLLMILSTSLIIRVRLL